MSVPVSTLPVSVYVSMTARIPALPVYTTCSLHCMFPSMACFRLPRMCKCQPMRQPMCMRPSNTNTARFAALPVSASHNSTLHTTARFPFPSTACIRHQSKCQYQCPSQQCPSQHLSVYVPAQVPTLPVCSACSQSMCQCQYICHYQPIPTTACFRHLSMCKYQSMRHVRPMPPRHVPRSQRPCSVPSTACLTASVPSQCQPKCKSMSMCMCMCWFSTNTARLHCPFTLPLNVSVCAAVAVLGFCSVLQYVPTLHISACGQDHSDPGLAVLHFIFAPLRPAGRLLLCVLFCWAQ
ncbi:hypothetical protein NEPAR04_2221 [Nematocida parisii]|nr:hypothetical protein NEPAR04_2221 [Nematocida parisii]